MNNQKTTKITHPFIMIMIGIAVGLGIGAFIDSIKVKMAANVKVEKSIFDTSFPINKLKEGGFVVLFRHSSRDKTKTVWGTLYDGFPKIIELDLKAECSPGSELNEKGNIEAQNIAAAMQERKIPIGEVLVSPTCRTLQMADIIFGKNYKVNENLVYIYMRDPRSHAEHNKALIKLLSRPTQKGKNRFLISHNNVLRKETMGKLISLKQSDAAVFQANADNEILFKGIIKKDAWLGDGVNL